MIEEGIDYYHGHLQRYGAIKNFTSDFWSYHSVDEWSDIINRFDELPCRCYISGFHLVKHTKMKNNMKNNMTNYVFIIIYW